MAKKKQIDDGRRMGKHCGYIVQEDGRIQPAPRYTDEFIKLSQERHGINDLMKLFTSHCADLLAEVGKRQSGLWKDLCDDYGLNRETHTMFFDGQYITVTPKPTAEEPSDSATNGTGAT